MYNNNGNYNCTSNNLFKRFRFVSVRFAWGPVGSSLVYLCEAVGVVALGLYGPTDIRTTLHLLRNG